MTPLQKLAVGELLILVDASVNGFDAIPDVLGWALIVMGLLQLRDRLTTSTLLPLASISGLVSLADLVPGLLGGLPPSLGWLLSLPQVAFDLVLCSLVAPLVKEPLAARFRGLRWVLVVVAVGPVLVFGGGLRMLLPPLALLAIGAGIYLVYLLFRASTEVHGPQIRLRGEDPDAGPATGAQTTPPA